MPNNISRGVAYEDSAIVGGSVNNSPIGATMPSTGAFTTLSTTGNSTLGDAAADLVGFHSTTGVAQAAFIATVTASTTITAVVAAVNAVLVALAAKGLMAAS